MRQPCYTVAISKLLPKLLLMYNEQLCEISSNQKPHPLISPTLMIKASGQWTTRPRHTSQGPSSTREFISHATATVNNIKNPPVRVSRATSRLN